MLPATFILFDTEFTAWEGSMQRRWMGPNEYREIIQIGAIRLEALQETASFSVLVRPVLNPVLSPFITALTGITQEHIDTEGVAFPEALERFLSYVGDIPAYSWGSDADVLIENCGFAHLQVPQQLHSLRNIRPLLTPHLERSGIDAAPYSSGTLIQAFGDQGLPAHDAVNDMRNLADVIRRIVPAV